MIFVLVECPEEVQCGGRERYDMWFKLTSFLNRISGLGCPIKKAYSSPMQSYSHLWLYKFQSVRLARQFMTKIHDLTRNWDQRPLLASLVKPRYCSSSLAYSSQF